ncbi:hypothetical protein I4I73_18220 [Pseudonocardia sp. KRD-184]|uniref:Integral membrane protein n=1 Tax=Pseudonocardia oceani TaxID=2792013 RepID=A0ABS6U9E7_9PSEU|nr:hypothetical protein [Pseudonocardia oceani]MBW0093817.1 hypothetical protein [Pseudonocardia oceani]MBW0097918.1 hypothetical protein [Pseudonocardia oceani]MBW0110507.1 hypothetical protein [Pseudonocardia oceani]MBW0124469.1 hypothetical protein [Pseudonocardia oceani]MBW0128858.1 hypothetical protein [Pseudonocardia oceani]
MDGVGAGVRGVALALLSALLTAAGHGAAGGALPDLALLVVLLPLLCGVLVTVAGRATGLVGLLGTLAAGQLALHHLLELLHPAHTAGPALLGPAGMWAMHGAATLVVAAAVRHADTAVAAVHAALARVLPRRTVPPPARRPLPAPVPAAPAAGLALAGALAATQVRRGPPAGC